MPDAAHARAYAVCFHNSAPQVSRKPGEEAALPRRSLEEKGCHERQAAPASSTMREQTPRRGGVAGQVGQRDGVS